MFATVAVLLSLAFLEGFARVAIWAVPAAGALSKRSFDYKLPDEELGMRGNPHFVDHDEAGWRNAERPERVAVVAVGDSQTYGSEVSRYDAWPQIASRESGVAIYNMAIGGYGPYQYSLLIDDALVLSPELVIVAFYDGNDYYDAWGKVYRQGRDPDLLSPDTDLRERLLEMEERAPLKADWEATRTARKGAGRAGFIDVVAWFDRNLAVFGLVRGVVVVLSGPGDPPESKVRRKFPKYLEVTEGAEPGLLVPFEDGDLSTVFTPRGRLATLDPEDPRVRESERLVFAYIDRIRAAVAGRARLAFVLIPTKELVYSERVSERVREKGAALHDSYAALVAAETTMRQRLMRRLDTLGVPWADSLPELRSSLAAGRAPYEMNWNGHPNPEGDAAIARAVVSSPYFRDLIRD